MGDTSICVFWAWKLILVQHIFRDIIHFLWTVFTNHELTESLFLFFPYQCFQWSHCFSKCSVTTPCPPPQPIFLPWFLFLPFHSCPSLHLPCVSQPEPSRGIGNPALMQATHTHTLIQPVREDYSGLQSSSPARHQILHPSPSWLGSIPLFCLRTWFTGTGLDAHFPPNSQL